jgi:hypothetical protein
MELVMPYVTMVWDYFRAGFYEVNAVLGLLIAAIAAYSMGAYKRLFVVALGAVIVHLIAEVMLPVLANGAAFRLPPVVEAGYWQKLAALYAGFLIVISLFYAVKRTFLSGGAH